MRRIILAVGVLLASALLLAAASAGHAASPTLLPATVELAIRGPNGRPVADTDILLFSRDEHVAAKTDADGLARFPWPYPAPIFVRVPGVGYGATGLFRLRAGKTVRVALPRLAPFGIVEGTVPAKSRKPGLVVSNDPWGVEKWLRSETVVGSDGHFVLKDVPAGIAQLSASVEGKIHPWAIANVFVEPGARIEHVAMAATLPQFEPDPVESKPEQQPAAPAEEPQPEPEPKPVEWAEGTVRDESGRPLEGVQVFASVLERGGTEIVNTASALTDLRGHWLIMGPPWPSPWPFVAKADLLFCKFGYCAAVVPMRCPKPPDNDGLYFSDKPPAKAKPPLPLAPRHFDVALSDHCGGMEVLITQDGKPLAGTTVSIAEDAPDDSHVLGAASTTIPWDDAAARILHPISVTGADGIARFNGLPPGNYSILVLDGVSDAGDTLRYWEPSFGATSPELAYHGIVVEAGKVRKFHALLHAGDYSVYLRITNPDGKPAVGLVPVYPPGGLGFPQTRDACDATGFAASHYAGPGLHDIAGSYLKERPSFDPSLSDRYSIPYCEINATVGASELLQYDRPLAIVATAHENVPGSLVVQLQGRNGKPVAGVVTADSQVASTDEQGKVRFAGLPAKVGVGAIVKGIRLPQFDQWNQPLPKDSELIGHWQYGDQVECRSGVETRLVLRPDPVGYIRGVVHPAADRNIEGYFVGRLSVNGSFRVPKSGEFVLGPYPVGKTTLELQYWQSSTSCEACSHKEVEVRSDRVERAEFDQTKSPHVPAVQTNPCFGAVPVTATTVDAEVSVFLPDGRTPAAGAQVALLMPNQLGAAIQGTADLHGRCTILAYGAVSSFGYIGRSPWSGWPPSDLETKRDRIAAEPTFVAWLPGQFAPAAAAAKTVDAQGKLRIVLPPSAVQRGKITIGGKPLAEQRGQLIVVARRETAGPLSGILARSVSADPEGNFELPALAPGVYQIQAALEGIWLSASVRVIVASDATPLKPIALDIGAPGPASTVAVIDQHGKALADVQVTVVRPPGPLATLLWTHVFKTDGAGVAQIPPLEAGRHEVEIAGIPSKSTLVVPPLGDPKAVPASLRVKQ